MRGEARGSKMFSRLFLKRHAHFLYQATCTLPAWLVEYQCRRYMQPHSFHTLHELWIWKGL